MSTAWMSLGEFIDRLEKIEPKAWVWIAGSPVYLVPTGFDSYRGYYDDLAIAATASRSPRIARELLDESKGCLDRTFTGYKGGEFRMHLGTKLWISNYGECSSALVTGIREIAGVGSWEITWRKDDE